MVESDMYKADYLAGYDKGTGNAGLGAGHIWTNMQCPAYGTLRGLDCTCNDLPA